MTLDWTKCEQVESVAGKMGGRPVVKGTRIEPDAIVQEKALGRTPDQTHADFPTLPVDTILQILAFAQKRIDCGVFQRTSRPSRS